MPFQKILSQKNRILRTWIDVEKEGNTFSRKREKKIWIFRGQDCDRPPTPVLARTIADLKLSHKDAFIFEFALMDRFTRNLYSVDPSITNDLGLVELLSVMRHYGAPTRLLDFTYSFYVAVFFAIESLKGKSPVVWAIDALWLVKRARKHLDVKEKEFMPGKYEEDFVRCFMNEDGNAFKPFVYQITPDQLNQRLSVQQGTFLCPSDIRLTFQANFAKLIANEKQSTINSHVKLIRISPDARNEILKKLSLMNISRASLFPGLDGFAKSIITSLLFPSTVEVYRNKRRAIFEREKNRSLSHEKCLKRLMSQMG